MYNQVRSCFNYFRKWDNSFLKKLSQREKRKISTLSRFTSATINSDGRFTSIHKRRYCTRPCWKCQRDIQTQKEQFFCECGVIQPPINDNLFKVMDIQQTFEIDNENLSTRFKDLQRRLHPDKFANKSEV